MTDRLQPLGSLESALREHAAAERAGVFATTPVDARCLLAPARLSVRRAVYRWTSIAAVLALVVGAWSTGVLRRAPMTQVVSASPCDGTFFGCVTGPTRSPGTPCSDFDYDADGDVDMADFRTYQLACEGITR